MSIKNTISLNKLSHLVIQLLKDETLAKKFKQSPESILQQFGITEVAVSASTISLPNISDLTQLVQKSKLWAEQDGDPTEEASTIPPFFRFNFRSPNQVPSLA